MSTDTAPPPALTAHIRPFPVTHPSLRRVRLSGRQADALAATIPVTLDGTSRTLPVAQTELAIQDAMRDLLGREVCAVLYRDRDGGDLSVLCGTGFVPVARITVTPARAVEVAA